MATQQSPTVRRRRLGHELRELREQAGLTLDEASARLEDFSAAKISRIETAKVGVRPRDVEDLLDLYGVHEAQRRKNLLTLTRESRQRGWWEKFGDAMSPSQDLYVGIEAEAVLIRMYSTQVVSGIFQTEAYAREILKVIWTSEPLEHIERRVKFRLERQKMLNQQAGLQVRCVLEESVLHRPVGGNDILRMQLIRLAEIAQFPNVSVQILPLSVGAHTGLDGAFRIMDLPPPDPSIVNLEYPTGATYIEDTEEVDVYSRIFGRLKDAALTVQQSLELITKLSSGEKSGELSKYQS